MHERTKLHEDTFPIRTFFQEQKILHGDTLVRRVNFARLTTFHRKSLSTKKFLHTQVEFFFLLFLSILIFFIVYKYFFIITATLPKSYLTLTLIDNFIFYLNLFFLSYHLFFIPCFTITVTLGQ